MGSTGTAMMLKALGLDPEEIKANIEGFMQQMRDQAHTINGNQLRIETKLDAIDGTLRRLAISAAAGGLGAVPKSTAELCDNQGDPTGVLVTNERFPQQLLEDVNGRVTHDDSGT